MTYSVLRSPWVVERTCRPKPNVRTLVAEVLEQRWNEKLHAVEALKGELDSLEDVPRPLSNAEKAAILALGEDFAPGECIRELTPTLVALVRDHPDKSDELCRKCFDALDLHRRTYLKRDFTVFNQRRAYLVYFCPNDMMITRNMNSLGELIVYLPSLRPGARPCTFSK